MQAGDELVDIGLVVVKGHAGAAAGKVLDASQVSRGCAQW